jgi:hypothetical protein
MKNIKNTQKMAKVLAVVMGASVLAGCEGPVGPQGDPGRDGIDGQNGNDGENGINGENGHSALIPLNFDGLWIFLEDETNRLDPSSTAVKFQQVLDSINPASLTDLKTYGSFSIIIRDVPEYGTGQDFFIIDRNSFEMRYEYVKDVDIIDFFTAVDGALYELKIVRTAIAPNSNALRLAVAPQKSIAPAADFPKNGARRQISV